MKYAPRDHQKEAIRDVVGMFSVFDRGQLISACGTGKTLTTRWITEEMSARLTLVFVPSIALLEQMARAWRENAAADKGYSALCVCSDASLSGGVDGPAITSDDLKDAGFRVESSPEDIAMFLRSGGNAVVFSTYQSSPQIEAAQRDFGGPVFDLVIADEAHRCAGDMLSPFAVVLDEHRIRAKKRLFVTATPRVFGARRGESQSSRYVDMENERVFGPRFHTLPFRKAIDLGLLCDYQVIVLLSSNDELRSLGQGADAKCATGPSASPRPLHQTGEIAAVSLLKAMEAFSLRRVITFHHTLARASGFAKEVNDVARAIEAAGRGGVLVSADFVSGAMSSKERRGVLKQFASSTGLQHKVLTNARCLTEGVDVPSIDGIAFIDPKASEIDIAQAIGRALRKSDGKALGTIVLPVLLGEGDTPSEVLQSTDFRSIWKVLNALRSHDEELTARFVAARSDALTGKASSAFNPFANMTFWGGQHAAEIAEAIRPVVVQELSDPWEVGFAIAQERFALLGDCNASAGERWPQKDATGFPLGRWLIAQRDARKRGQLSAGREARLNSLGIQWRVTDAKWHAACDAVVAWIAANGSGHVPVGTAWRDGTRSLDLGLWASVQRRHHRNGLLAPDKVEKLTSSGFAWSPLDDAFQQGLAHLTRWLSDFGHCNVPQTTVLKCGFKLGKWLSVQRSALSKGQLATDRKGALDALGLSWDVRTDQWEVGFDAARAYAAIHGHCNAPKREVSPDGSAAGFPLGTWLSTQRRHFANGTLPDTRIGRLDGLGMQWSTKHVRHDAAWSRGLEKLLVWQQENDGRVPPQTTRCADGFHLEGLTK